MCDVAAGKTTVYMVTGFRGRAIVEGGKGTFQEKVDALLAVNVKVAENPEQIPDLL